jgi:hypothetical protein
VAVLVPLLAALPALAQEPSLAEAAAQQKKARKGEPIKVITDYDLQGVRSRNYVAPEASPTGATPAAKPADAGTAKTAPAKTEDQLRAEKKAEIDQKIKQWDGFIAETQKSMDEAQLELNDLSSLTYGGRRAGLQMILDDGAKHIAEAKQAIADLAEEARRAGLPLSR